MTTKPQTLYEKIWDAHVVERRDDGTDLIYIDRHLVHEVTSPQAFEGLRVAGRKVRRPDLTLAVPDHNLPTTPRRDAAGNPIPIADRESANQLDALRRNVAEFGVPYIDALAAEQGIVHVVGPEQGFTLPGTTMVCGDSHTSAHGALGALAFGIGTSEVEHVLATQTLLLQRSKTMEVRVEGNLGFGVSAKDVVLAIIGRIGAAGGTGHVIEYTGDTIRGLSVEGRLTVANMSIEGGARAGLIAPDETTFAYIKGRPMAPTGEEWEKAVAWWRTLPTDAGAVYDAAVRLSASDIAPSLTWGTSPEDVVSITGLVPDPESFADLSKRVAAQKSLDYMGLTPGTAMQDVPVEHVFIGSCTNSRIEDLRAAASVANGRHVADGVRALVVPGSGLVKRQAEAEGLDRIFISAGFEWREPGCSMCLAMNPDKVPAGQRCASTSNRNFVGRQGPGARTHLVSPAMAAAAAVTGRLTDVRDLMGGGNDHEARACHPDRRFHHQRRRRDRRHGHAGSDIHDEYQVTPVRDVEGRAYPWGAKNVDTDVIIPAHWLKTISRAGMGKGAFETVRAQPGNIFDDERYAGSPILIAGDNFGCGSSREHAAWALKDMGVQAVIAPSYSDIFSGNAVKNGIVPVVLPQEAIDRLIEVARTDEIHVDLETMTVTTPFQDRYEFSMDPFRRQCLMEGLDEVGLTLAKDTAISKYESAVANERPWLARESGNEGLAVEGAGRT